MPQHIREEILYDVRLQPRHLERGQLTAADLKRYLDGLPDRAEHSQSIDVEKLAGRG